MIQETQIKKKRNFRVLALTIICVILAASLVGVVAVYQPSQISEKQATIDSLNDQIDALQLQLSQTTNTSTYSLQIAYLNSQVSDLNDQILNLNDTLTSIYAEYANLQNIVKLNKSGLLYDATITQNANTTTTLWNNELNFAGFIVVDATASSNTTYAEVLFIFGDANFDYNQTLGISGTAIFPVLPSTVEIRIGNTIQSVTNNATVTATYYY